MKLPAAIVLVPVWVGTGLLAAVALGLPLGLIAQAIVGGSPVPAENGLRGWVYAVVYGGFIVQAVALLTAFVLYARFRWAGLWDLPAVDRIPDPKPRPLVGAGVVAAVVYGAANIAWAVAGESLEAPPDFDTAAQKSLLVSTGFLALVGAFAVQRVVHGRRMRWVSDRLWAPFARLGRQCEHVRIRTQPARAGRRRRPGAFNGCPARPWDRQRADAGRRDARRDRRRWRGRLRRPRFRGQAQASDRQHPETSAPALSLTPGSERAALARRGPPRRSLPARRATRLPKPAR